MTFFDLLRPVLFRLDPERAHHLTLALLRIAGSGLFAPMLHAQFRAPDAPVTVCGITFKNRVGLAAGYDKTGSALAGLAALGFGHLEIGTVTRLAQAGNPKPRVHRFPEARSIVNSMGFPNDGITALLRNMRGVGRPFGAVLGINIGKGKDTPLERAHEDYVALLEEASPHADYIAVNISSPNTMNLRQLQARDALEQLLGTIMRARNGLETRKPVLVKIAPDLNATELEDAVGAVVGAGADGLIATNTTVSRAGLPAGALALKGGASGAVLTAHANDILRDTVRLVGGKIPVIGVGGIMAPEDVQTKLDAGAALVQLYTGLVYAGPGLVKRINTTASRIG